MLLPSALAVGVDFDTFWKINPRQLATFVKVADQKAKRRADEINHAAWLYGGYVQRAIVAALVKNSKYPETPLGSKDKTKVADKFRAWATAFNAQREEGK